LFSFVCNFLSADVGAMPWFLAVEALVILHEFYIFLSGMGLAEVDFIDYS
jgi:hypothetical protein